MPKRWMEEKCVLCTLCVAICPYEAIKQKNGKIILDYAKCADCEECLPSVGCPRRALTK